MCLSITLPKRNDAEVVPLTVNEVEAMAAAVPERYRALIVLAAGMGLRQGECFGLTVDRVDFLRRQVRVDRQLVASLRAAQDSAGGAQRRRVDGRAIHARYVVMRAAGGRAEAIPAPARC